MMSATPPFATTEPAADEAVEEEAGIVAEAGEEAVDPPLVVGYSERDVLALDPPAAVDAEGVTTTGTDGGSRKSEWDTIGHRAPSSANTNC